MAETNLGDSAILIEVRVNTTPRRVNLDDPDGVEAQRASLNGLQLALLNQQLKTERDKNRQLEAVNNILTQQLAATEEQIVILQRRREEDEEQGLIDYHRQLKSEARLHEAGLPLVCPCGGTEYVCYCKRCANELPTSNNPPE